MIRTKNKEIYIVTYHYVREIKKSKYPNLKGLEFEEFKKQINYFQNNFNILSNDDFIEIIKSKKIPKKNQFFLHLMMDLKTIINMYIHIFKKKDIR